MRVFRLLIVLGALLASVAAFAESPAPTPKAPAPKAPPTKTQIKPKEAPSPYNFLTYRTQLDRLRAEIERFRTRLALLQARAGATVKPRPNK